MLIHKKVVIALWCVIGMGVGTAQSAVKTVILQQGLNWYTGSKGAGFWDPTSALPANALVANVSKEYYYLDDGG